MDKTVAVCLSLAIWLSLLQYGMNTARLGESKVSYGVLDDAVRPHLIARMPLTGTSVKEWVAMTTPAHSKYVYIHRRWTYRKSRQRFPPSWFQTMLLRILLTVLRLRDRLMVLCIRVLLAVLRSWIFLVLLRIRAHRQAMRVYHVLHPCLQSVVHYPLVLVTMVTGYAASVVEMLLMRSGDVEPNPGPTGQLCPDDLVTVLTELIGVCAEWENIGLALKLAPGTLDAMKGPYKQPRDCLRDMLREWLTSSPDPSWEKLISALRHPIVGQERLATYLEQIYCTQLQERSESPEASGPVEVVHCPTIREQTKELDKDFRSLVKLAHDAVLQKGLDLSRFREGVARVPPEYQSEHRKFIEEGLINLSPTATVTDIWVKLNTYWNYFNYGLLEQVIEEFEIKDLEQKMERYVKKLDAFKRSTKLIDFVQRYHGLDHVPTVLGKLRELGKVKEVKFKNERPDWTSCTLWEVEEFKRTLITKFFIPSEFLLIFEGATEGCICVTWLTPVYVASILETKLKTTPSEFFEENGIREVTIDGHQCYPCVHPSTTSGSRGVDPAKELPQPSPVPQATDIKGNIQKLERSFNELAQKSLTSLQQLNIDGSKLTSCLQSVGVRIHDDHEEVLKEDFAEKEYCRRLMPVWKQLIKYCDFLNYHLLQRVINTFGDDSLRMNMKEYIKETKLFHRTTPLCKFVENWPKQEVSPEEKFRTLAARMSLDWSKCTVEDIELFRDALSQTLNSILLLKEIRVTGKRHVLITWYIPLDTAITLKKDLQNTRDRELFEKHRVEWLTVDGEYCFYSPLRRYANFLKDTYTSENPPAGLTTTPPSDAPLQFSLAKIEKEQISKEKSDPFTQSTLRGDKDDIPRKKTKISFTDVGRLPGDSSSRLVLIEGAPGVGKTTFSWEYCRRWARGELLQMMSLVLLLPLRDNRIRAAKSLSDLFYHSDPELRREFVQELERSQGEGVVIWLEALDEFGQSLREQPNSIFLDLILGKVLPKATIFITSRPHGSQFLLEQHEQRIAQHVEILGSAREQIQAVAKTPSSIGRRFLTFISENPMIKAVMYTPVTSAMVLEVFNYSLAKNINLPATMTELYTAFTCKRLSDYLSHHPEYGTQQWTVHKFSDLPHKVHVQFRELCALAYRGIENNQQIVFSNLPPWFDSLGLMQEVPQLYIKETAPSSYNFIHLTVQEYLAAVHLSGKTPYVQTELILKQRQYRRRGFGELTFAGFGHYNMIFRFLSGLTKMVHIPPSITDQMLGSRGTLEQPWGRLGQLSLSHWLYEAQDSERTAITLGKREKVVTSEYSWTPLDYYVTGYCISHSHCPWGLEFGFTSFDDEAMEMLSRGCSTAPDPTYTGYISRADFTHCNVTSKVIEHFTQLPQHILQSMRELRLQRNNLDGEACNLLATIIPTGTMNSLEELILSHNPIPSGGAVELIKALCGHTRLRVLDLGRTNIGEEDCECLSELLASSQSLTHLSVCYNHLSPVSVGHIISGLSHNSSLTYLDMSGSEFSEDNTVHLSTVLRDTQRCKLEELSLVNCSITASGACHLAESLHTNSTLKALWLNKNPIGVDGASAFAAMLPVNTSLEDLHLRDDSIGEEGVQQLIKCLNTNKTLKELWLPGKYRQSSTERIRWWF